MDLQLAFHYKYRLIRYRIKKRNIHIGRLMPIKGYMAWEIQILRWIVMLYHKKGRVMIADYSGYGSTVGIGPLRFWRDKYWNSWSSNKRQLRMVLLGCVLAVLTITLLVNLTILASIIASDTAWCIENSARVPHCLVYENNIFGRFIHPSY